MGLLECLYIGGDIVRTDRRQRQVAIFAPGEELGARVRVARIRVADVGGEKFHSWLNFDACALRLGEQLA